MQQGRGTDEAGLAAQRGRQHPQAGDEIQPDIQPDMVSQGAVQRLEEQRPGLGHPATDDHQVQITHRGDRGDHRRERTGGPPERAQRNLVPARGSIGQVLRGGLRARRPAAVAGPGDQARAARDRLNASASSAGAARTVTLDDHVADVPGVPGAPGVGPAVEHQPATDPGGHHHPEQEARPPPRTAPVLAQGHAQTVAGKTDRDAGHRSGDALTDPEVPPGGDVDRADGSLREVDRPGRGDSRTPDVPVGRRQRTGDGVFGGSPHHLGIVTSWRGPLLAV